MGEKVEQFGQQTLGEMARVVVGQTEIIEQILAAILVGGHVLLEGVPGLAKTLIAKALAYILDVDFHRIQFTPDLMPSDIVGTEVFDMEQRVFLTRKGPIFAGVLLADEINRTPPKTQAALLEAMQERQVTIGKEQFELPPLFTVLATQNPIEFEGTYPLPEAQLDRFMVKVRIEYPSSEEELQILALFDEGKNPFDFAAMQLRTLFSTEDVLACRREVTSVIVKPEVLEYILSLVHQARSSPRVTLGPSPRAGIALLLVSKAFAALSGRDFVTPDDVQAVVYPVLRHRIILTPESEIEGVTEEDIVRVAVEAVKVPR